MDTWPGFSDGLPPASTPPKAKRKDKAEEKLLENPWRYPVLEHGTLGSATLKRLGKRYEWTFVAQSKSKHKLVAQRNPVEVFPATRPTPWRTPKVTPLQQAEQGAHFIRTFYPDVDVPTELMRNEIAEDARITTAWKKVDTLSGNMLEVASYRTCRMSVAYLVFPMGRTNCQLNMSPLVTYAGKEAELKPTAQPVHTFDTPIRQIVATPGITEVGKGKSSPMLGVRTMGQTILLQANLRFFRSKYSVEVAPLTAIERSDLGDRHATDIVISSVDINTSFIANESGDIFRCIISKNGRSIERVHHADTTTPVFCRLAACETREKLLSISDRVAFALDFRTGREPYTLHSVSQPGVQLTSIESLEDDHIIRLVTTEEIIWLDERNTRRSLLGFKHRRDFDTTLRSQTHVLANAGPLTFLTSRRNSLVTVYDVRESDQNLLHMFGTPYALPSMVTPDVPNLGYALFEPNTTDKNCLSILQLSESGSVSLLNLAHRPSVPDLNTRAEMLPRPNWPSDIQELMETVAKMRPDLGTLATRTHTIMDLSAAYQKLFVQREEPDLLAQADDVFNTLERMPMFWQDSGAPVEHAVTMFDIAMRSGVEPTEVTRNDWFTGTSLDSAAGYRALEQGHIPRDKLRRSAPGRWDISHHIRRQIPEFDDNPQKTIENLVRYDLADDLDRTADSFRRESEARSQLTLDLSLASDVFSPQHPGKDASTTFDDDMLSISLSTQAMFLEDLEPPPLQFSFLRPLPKKLPHAPLDYSSSETTHGDCGDSRSIFLPGVRLLLQEWEVGSDPDQYIYRDPYDDDSPTTPPVAPRRSAKEPSRGEEARAPTQTVVQRPPLVGSSVPHAPPTITASRPAPTRRPLVAARSHDALFTQHTLHADNDASQPTRSLDALSSQEPISSTQVLPGPHGGRSNAAKKRPAKKRLGGF